MAALVLPICRAEVERTSIDSLILLENYSHHHWSLVMKTEADGLWSPTTSGGPQISSSVKFFLPSIASSHIYIYKMRGDCFCSHSDIDLSHSGTVSCEFLNRQNEWNISTAIYWQSTSLTFWLLETCAKCQHTFNSALVASLFLWQVHGKEVLSALARC